MLPLIFLRNLFDPQPMFRISSLHGMWHGKSDRLLGTSNRVDTLRDLKAKGLERWGIFLHAQFRTDSVGAWFNCRSWGDRGLAMKKYIIWILPFILLSLLGACAHVPPERYNTQKGAAVGAGFGALVGQMIGHSTKGTLLGLGAGTVLGALVGNAMDQQAQAARDAAHYDRPVVYYDSKGSAVEAIPQGGSENANCRRVTKRVWENGELVSETVEEICEEAELYEVKPPVVYRCYPRVYLYYHHPLHRPRWARPYPGCR